MINSYFNVSINDCLMVVQAVRFCGWFSKCHLDGCDLVCSLKAQWSQRRRFRKLSSSTRCTSNRLCLMKKAGGKSLRYTQIFFLSPCLDPFTEKVTFIITYLTWSKCAFCYVRNMMVDFLFGLKLSLRVKSYREAMCSSLWKTQILTSTGSPTTLR